MNNKFFIHLALLFALFNGKQTQAQVTILNSNASAFNITPQSLCEVNLMNSGPDIQIALQASLTDASNAIVLTSKTAPFTIKKGMNPFTSIRFGLSSTEFGSSNVATYAKTFHTLPTGKYQYCVSIVSSVALIEAEQYCQEIDAENSDYMFLISPSDKDTINMPNPLLSWGDGEPFSNTPGNESFRMVLVELTPGQGAEAGITTNVPVFIKTNLTTYQVQYPYDAEQLVKGKHYGWQVQKMIGNVIIDKTEAWEFILATDKPIIENKYAIMKKKLDAGFYIADNDKIFFRFDERYSGGSMTSTIYDQNRNIIKPKSTNVDQQKTKTTSTADMGTKDLGYNRFEINLDAYTVTTGFYTLEVKDQKGEVYLLKFYVQ